MAWLVRSVATSRSTSISRPLSAPGGGASSLQEGLDVTELGDGAQLCKQLPRRLEFQCALLRRRVLDRLGR